MSVLCTDFSVILVNLLIPEVVQKVYGDALSSLDRSNAFWKSQSLSASA